MPASTTTTAAGDRGGGAGLSLTKSGVNNPNPIQHGGMGQAERAFSAASTFLSGVMAISASQFIGAPLKYVDPKFYDGYMAWTKESFAVLMTTITQWWSPTEIRVSGDESMKGQLYQMQDGTLKCNFPHRLVLMANHQLYTDWLYLWWIAYTNKMHGRIYIILKESLKQLPIIGWSAQFYNFIFLSRKWETDKFRFRRALNPLKSPKDPMWLMIFPEGTNLSGVTREKSAAWAKKTGVKDMKHQLLPRSTGLQFCLKELRETTNWLYDCTIAYEGVPKGMYGQDIFTLKSSFFEGRPPKSVNMYWRRYRISEIPLDNDEAFGRWLQNRWREKDYLLEYFYKYSQFPADDPVKALQAAEGKKAPNHAKSIITQVQGGGWDEFLSIFGPMTSAAGALSAVDMTEPMNVDAIMAKLSQLPNMDFASLAKQPMPATSQEAIRRALAAANQHKKLPKPVYDTLMREAPTTQKGMKRALQNSGNASVATKATQAPSSTASVAPSSFGNITQTARQAQSVIRQMSAPAVEAKAAMPLANIEAMVTRPLSTMAIQKAGGVLREGFARAQSSGNLPTQKTPGAKPKANGAARAPTVRQNSSPAVTKSTPAAKKSAPPKASSVSGAKASSVKASGPPKKLPAGSKPIGTVKYANGKKV